MQNRLKESPHFEFVACSSLPCELPFLAFYLSLSFSLHSILTCCVFNLACSHATWCGGKRHCIGKQNAKTISSLLAKASSKCSMSLIDSIAVCNGELISTPLLNWVVLVRNPDSKVRYRTTLFCLFLLTLSAQTLCTAE